MRAVKPNTVETPSITVYVSMLGGLRLEVEGKVLTDQVNRSQKLWNVLCYLLLHRDRDVTQAELVELLWPGENSSNPVNALKTLLYRVRSLLEPMFPDGVAPILSKRGAYCWNPAVDCRLDIDRFDALYARAGQSGLRDAARREG